MADFQAIWFHIYSFLKICNRWLYYSPSEMITELDWLRDTLIEAEKNNENVHILGKNDKVRML